MRARFIPACAGFWHTAWTGAGAAEVHPRVCGVLRIALQDATSPLGSSPRVRGFGRDRCPADSPGRFIPACAGFWFVSSGYDVKLRVHPRVCGVLKETPLMWRTALGSSPRVRGFGLRADAEIIPVRFIPACAGFCAFEDVGIDGPRVHPRVCGVLSA